MREGAVFIDIVGSTTKVAIQRVLVEDLSYDFDL